MKIAVFCSANKNIDPDFFTMTEEMGKWMAEKRMIRGTWRDVIEVADNLEELKAIVENSH